MTSLAADGPRGRVRRRPLFRAPSIIPGFGLTFGLSLTWLCLIVLIPLSAVFIKTAGMGWQHFADVALSERAIAAYRLSFGASLGAAFINSVFGLLIAWMLVRYDFPGKRVVNALVDLPFALPTAVAGIAFTTLYTANGWIGRVLEPLGIQVAFTWVGVVITLIFIGLPFVVRSVEPVLADVSRDVEEAAASLGATRAQTFRRVILPAIFPALMTGFAMAFARGVGEYGSVIFIAGNMPYRTEIAPLLIITQLEQYDYQGATGIATVMLIASFSLLLVINLLQAWSRKRTVD
ncbi:sulfate ABC transporter permease subunit CysT [Edaphosphingomonas haloaromaticamans]|uniref:Sulfate transport system permease protein CysT n=1 Tax=Edaphosphingomonas haloaromaticamans TaxID=653954 RepID=A0A1S1HHY8_9SPHN|nr:MULTISPECIES: sulfate ABC transporter permease subunit CysT [Sphingomonas]MDX3885596.1 sulfate ABC transporter permease subunit CysT [Sphingomonas sp.]OHT21081.1 Sulfate transport system permease protein CysT [Sphingomonas haloaromaticamans]